MIVKEKIHNLKTEGLEDGLTYSVSESSFIYELLSTKLYKNPHQAVVREISINGCDANIENRKDNTPIDLHLPTISTPYFVVKDYGVGLSPERIKNTYTKLGESTKRNTNKQTGSWGLGCHSVWSLADQFTIETVHQSTKYIYVVFKNQKGIPELSSDNYEGEPTTEPSGTKITIPIKSKDINQVREEGIKLFRFFKVQPKCNVTLPTYTNLIETSSYTLESAAYYGATFAVMGSIVYPVDKNIMRGEHLSNYNVYLHFKIGDLSVETSRDGLVYDDKTKKVITEKWKTFRSEVKSEIEKRFEGLKDWELYCKKNEVHKKFRDLISCESQITLTKECGSIEYLGYGGNRLRALKSYIIEPEDNIRFFIKDKPDRFLAPLKRYVESNHITPYFIENEQSKIDEVLKITGYKKEDLLKTSMFKAEPVKRASSNVQSLMRFCYNLNESNAFRPINVMPTTPIKYYVIRKGTKVFHNYPHSPASIIKRVGMKYNLNGEQVTYKGELVYAVLEREVKRLPKDAINVVDDFVQENSKKIGGPELEKIEKYGSINLNLFSNFESWGIKKLKEVYDEACSLKEEARKLSLIKMDMCGLGVKFCEVTPTSYEDLKIAKIDEQCKLLKYLKVPGDTNDKKYLAGLIEKELESLKL